MRTTSNSITHLYEPNPDQVKFINHMNRNGYGPNKTFPITLHFRTFKRDSGGEREWLGESKCHYGTILFKWLFHHRDSSFQFGVDSFVCVPMALTNCIVVHFQIKRIRPPFHVRHPNSVRISICLYWRYSSDGSQILAPFCGSLVYFSETALTRLIKIKQNMQPQLDFPISTRSLSRFIPISIRRTSLEAEQT